MGLIEMLTVYIWNWFVYGVAFYGLYMCWMQGVWGLFWADDNGVMMSTCLELWNGNSVTFPVDYSDFSES